MAYFRLPYRSWQTKGRSRVMVGGCYLPVPLGFCTLLAAGGAVAHHAITTGAGPV